MREVKFRAWWKSEAAMLHNVHLFYDTLGDKKHGNQREPENSFGALLEGYDKNDYVVMQYTGLKDKSGVEIYEGDIVDGKWSYASRCVVEWDEKRAGFYLRPIDGLGKAGCDKGYKLNSGRYVVVGNIYDSPELLEEE